MVLELKTVSEILIKYCLYLPIKVTVHILFQFIKFIERFF